jgi:manganese/zinc/iron transport system substrate-binding protein
MLKLLCVSINRVIRKSILIGVILVATTGSGCVPADPDVDDGRISVVTTTGMIGDLAAVVGGERTRVVSLMGPGVDPHLYKASEGDVRRIFRAQVIFFNGLHLEARMGEVLEHMDARTRTVAIAEAIDPRRLLRPPEFEGAYDPHIWFDVTLWMEMVGAVRDAMVEQDPEHAAGYRERAAEYLAELDELDSYVRAQAARVPAERRVLVTAHDAFNYFGRAYGFEVRGLQGISTAAEAGTADVQELSAFIAQRRIPAVFVESSVSPRSVEAVQAAVRARGFRVEIGGELFSDALGRADSEAGTYVGMVRHNIDTIVGALLRDTDSNEP